MKLLLLLIALMIGLPAIAEDTIQITVTVPASSIPEGKNAAVYVQAKMAEKIKEDTARKLSSDASKVAEAFKRSDTNTQAQVKTLLGVK